MNTPDPQPTPTEFLEHGGYISAATPTQLPPLPDGPAPGAVKSVQADTQMIVTTGTDT